MDVSRIAQSVPIVSASDAVTKVAAKLRAADGVAIVMKGTRFLGMITADDLARHKIESPHKAAVGKFATRTSIQEGLDLDAAIHALLVENHEAIPVMADGSIKAITKLNLLTAIATHDNLRGLTAKDVMAFPYCVHEDESVATALAMLRDLNISRLPVVDDRDRILGAVDSLDLLAAQITPIERTARTGAKPNRIKAEPALRSFLREAPIAKPDATIPALIDLMQRKRRAFALIADQERIAGIITPKRIFKLLGEERKGAYVNISGLQDADPYLKELVDKEVERHLRVVSRQRTIDQLIVHFRTYAHGGARKQYEAKARLITEKGYYFSEAVAWDFTKAMGKALSNIEREVLKKDGRAKARNRRA